jgi:hypothetical protein
VSNRAWHLNIQGIVPNRALQSHRRLLLIDSLEELLLGNEEGWSEFEDDVFLAFFQQVLSAETFQSRIILTSQELPTQLLTYGSRYQTL